MSVRRQNYPLLLSNDPDADFPSAAASSSSPTPESGARSNPSPSSWIQPAHLITFLSPVVVVNLLPCHLNFRVREQVRDSQIRQNFAGQYKLTSLLTGHNPDSREKNGPLGGRSPPPTASSASAPFLHQAGQGDLAACGHVAPAGAHPLPRPVPGVRRRHSARKLRRSIRCTGLLGA